MLNDCFKRFESSYKMDILCTTKVYIRGILKMMTNKDISAQFENDRFVYRLYKEPVCESMINFLQNLKKFPNNTKDNVLEDFSILQVPDTMFYLTCFNQN